MNIQEMVTLLINNSFAEANILQINIQGEINPNLETCFYRSGKEKLFFSPHFNRIFCELSFERLHNLEQINTSTGNYLHTIENGLGFDKSDCLWYFIKREFPFSILEKDLNIKVANIIIELHKTPVVVGTIPNDTSYFDLYACHDLTKDLEVLKIINKNRKPISLKNFEVQS